MLRTVSDQIERLDRILERIDGKAQGDNRHEVNGTIDVARENLNELRIAVNESIEPAPTGDRRDQLAPRRRESPR
jgi:ferritin-like metal-binding protein YciE